MHTKLLRSQRNEIFALATEAGLAPQDFEWTEVETRWGGRDVNLVDQLLHKPTGYHFTFDTIEGEALPRYSPSKDGGAEKIAGRMKTWHSVLEQIRVWVFLLKNEVLEPDLWRASLDDTKLIAKSIDEIENAPFTPAEQQRLKLGIAELRNFLRSTTDHSDAQLKFIDARLQHLEDSSQRLGRKDWITLAMGTLTNIIVGVALTPDGARELVRTAGSLLGWVIGGVQLLP
jgi:hypothetical protein